MRVVYLVLFLLLILTGSCNTNSPAGRNVSCQPSHIDTFNANKTYAFLAKCDPATIDSIYNDLFDFLISENKYELALQHASLYRNVAQGEKASATIAKAEGYYYNYRAQYDSAHLFFDESIRLFRKMNKKDGLADAYSGLASNYEYQGDYANAWKYHRQSIELYEQLNDSGNIARQTGEMAVDLYYQKEFDKAIDLANASRNYYLRHSNKEMIAYSESILATLYYNIKDYKKSIDYSLSSLAIRKKLGNPRDMGESLNNLSLGYMATEKWQEAADALSEAIRLMQASNDFRQLPIIKQNLANCIWRLGDRDKAIAMLNEVIVEARQKEQKDAIANAYKKLYSIYKESKQFDSALKYYQHYKVLSDTLYSIEKANAINELNIKYETAQKEQKIRQLNVEKKISGIKQGIYLLLLFFIIIVTTLTILYLSSRNRKNKLLVEKVQMELATNQKDLDQFTTNIISKNKLIDDLEEKLHVLSTQRPVAQNDNDALSVLYQFKILTEDDWRDFKIHFDKVYPGYINNLRKQFPDLSPAEERQLLLIKLNIDNKECANMLGISAQSVKKNRYRLKKKFNLSENDSLDDFVRTLVL